MSDEPMLPRTPRQAIIDCAAIFALGLAATLSFGPVFGGVAYLIAGVGGTLLGIAVGVATSLRPLRGWLMTAAGVVLVLVLLGPALAVPRKAIGGVIPTLEAWQELLLGVVFSWKGLLTAEPPAEGFPSLLVVPFLTLLVCATLATVLAMRLRRGAPFAMLPGIAALIVGIVFGTKIAFLPAVLGLVVAGVVIGWWAWRRAEWRTGLNEEVEVTGDSRFRGRARKQRTRGAVGMVAAALLVAGLISIPIQPASRAVLRDTVEPPIELAEYPSPLAGFRDWHKNFEDSTLMTVTGMPEGSRLRLATFDYYDGTVYAVAGTQQSGSGSFARIGDEVLVQQSGTPATVQVQLQDYSGIWVPEVGYIQSLDFGGAREDALQGSLHYNGQTGTAIALEGLGAGDSYQLEAIVPTQPEHEELAGATITDVQVPDPAVVPDLLQAWVATWGNEGQDRLENIQNMQRLMQNGSFSHGLEDDTIPSLAGHGASRIQSMFDRDVLVGDDEQYATAFALALDRINVPARVVMGLYPDDGFPGGDQPVELTGGEMHAWVEVPFEGYGWVRFDPTPPEDNDDIQPEPEPEPDPRPQVLQPPQPPEEPADLSPDTVADEGQEDDEELEDTSWVVWLWVGGSTLLLLLLLASPFIVVGAIKAARWRRRYRSEQESDRLSGGWHEVVDHAVDLGLPVPAGVTRREVAATVEDRYPRSRATEIGEFVDEGVFGPGMPVREDVDAFWLDVERSVKGMETEARPMQRLRARLSLRSFARRRRERRRR